VDNRKPGFNPKGKSFAWRIGKVLPVVAKIFMRLDECFFLEMLCKMRI